MSVRGPLARDLNRRLLCHVLADTTDHAEECRVDAAVYTDGQRLRRERERLFLSAPQIVAFSAELPVPGSWLPLSVCDVPILLCRDQAGQIRAFLNACAHRAAPLAQTAGEGRSLVCPFHGWSYHLDGQLRGRPGAGYFETGESEDALISLPVAEVAGLVVVNVEATRPVPDVESLLGGFADEIRTLGIDRHVLLERRVSTVAADWKLVTELSLESYHFKRLHRDSVAAVMHDNAVVDTEFSATRWAFPYAGIEKLAEMPEDEWPDELQGSCTYTFLPGVMLLANASGLQMIRAEPTAVPGQCQVSYVGVAPPEADREAAHAAYNFGGDVFTREDLPMAEAMQIGLSHGARGSRFGRNEPLLAHWHRLWAQSRD